MTTDLVNDGLPEIEPVGVHGLDQCQLSFSRTGLDLLFPGDGGKHLLVDFIPDEQLAAVPSSEAGLAFPVLPNALKEVRGDAGIDRPIPATCHDGDGGL